MVASSWTTVWAAFGVLALTASSAAPQGMPKSNQSPGNAEAVGVIKVIHFPGGTALPLYVAQDKGFFRTEGLSVALTPTFNSQQLMTGMLQNEYEIGQAAIDNLIAYDEKQAAPDLNITRDLVAFMGTSSTNLDLLVQPSILSYTDLKGKMLAVDAPSTGFAFVLRKMLENGGLHENDYSFLPVGGDKARLEALRAQKASGALLVTDFADQAIANGLMRLATSLDVLHHYQGTSLFTRSAWAQTHRQDLIKFIRAVLKAHDWIFDAEHQPEAAKILLRTSNGLPLDVANKAITRLVLPQGGLSRSGALDSEGIQVVLALRSQYGMPKKTLTDPRRYIDTSYYEEAVGR